MKTEFQQSIFTGQDWYDVWIDAFGGRESGIWQWREQGNAVSVPYVLVTQLIGPFPIRVAKGAANDHTPRFDVIGNVADPSRMFPRMMSELDVSYLSFDYLSERSRLMQAIRARPPGLLFQVDLCESSPYVNCELDWRLYWTQLGNSTRSLWARRERRLMGDHGARFHCLLDWAEVKAVLSTIYDIEASGWKGRQGSAIKQNPATLKFYDACVRAWAEKGALRLFLLSLKDEIIAFQLDVLHVGVLTQLKIGYLEKYAKHSPGQVLQLQILRWAFENPEVKIYDMLGGGGKALETKLKWATGAEQLYTVRVFRKTPGGWLAWARFVIAPRVKRALYRLAGKTPGHKSAGKGSAGAG